MSAISYSECEAAPYARLPKCPTCEGFLVTLDTKLSQCTKERRVYRCNLCNRAVPLYRADWPRVVYRVPLAKGVLINNEMIEE